MCSSCFCLQLTTSHLYCVFCECTYTGDERHDLPLITLLSCCIKITCGLRGYVCACMHTLEGVFVCMYIKDKVIHGQGELFTLTSATMHLSHTSWWAGGGLGNRGKSLMPLLFHHFTSQCNVALFSPQQNNACALHISFNAHPENVHISTCNGKTKFREVAITRSLEGKSCFFPSDEFFYLD